MLANEARSARASSRVQLVPDALNNLAMALESQGRHAEAEPVRALLVPEAMPATGAEAETAGVIVVTAADLVGSNS